MSDFASTNRLCWACKRLRRCGTFTLTSLFVCILIVACVVQSCVLKVQRQKEAVARIHSLGGNVLYDFEAEGWDNSDNRFSFLSRWLRSFAGVDYGGSVVSVTLADAEVDDSSIQSLRGLPTLRHLDLQRTTVTDEALSHLGCLGELEELWLSNTAVSDRGLEKLRKVESLRSLVLDYTKITDAGIPLLRNSFMDEPGFSRLEDLEVRGTSVTDAGLEQLVDNVAELRSLTLVGTKCTHKGVERLQRHWPNCLVVF